MSHVNHRVSRYRIHSHPTRSCRGRRPRALAEAERCVSLRAPAPSPSRSASLLLRGAAARRWLLESEMGREGGLGDPSLLSQPEEMIWRSCAQQATPTMKEGGSILARGERRIPSPADLKTFFPPRTILTIEQSDGCLRHPSLKGFLKPFFFWWPPTCPVIQERELWLTGRTWECLCNPRFLGIIPGARHLPQVFSFTEDGWGWGSVFPFSL